MTPQEKKDAYRAKEAERRSKYNVANGLVRKPARGERREDAMYRWAKRYDDLNGRPESEYDR